MAGKKKSPVENRINLEIRNLGNISKKFESQYEEAESEEMKYKIQTKILEISRQKVKLEIDKHKLIRDAIERENRMRLLEESIKEKNFRNGKLSEELVSKEILRELFEDSIKTRLANFLQHLKRNYTHTDLPEMFLKILADINEEIS